MLTVENVIKDPKLYAIKGNVHLHEGISQGGLPNVPPVNIIQTDQNLYAHFTWRQTGFLSKMLSGRWQLRIFFELMGAGEAANPAPRYVNFVQQEGYNYHAFINVPAGSLREGIYKVFATVQLEGLKGNPTPIAAYEEIGVLQVYND